MLVLVEKAVVITHSSFELRKMDALQSKIRLQGYGAIKSRLRVTVFSTQAIELSQLMECASDLCALCAVRTLVNRKRTFIARLGFVEFAPLVIQECQSVQHGRYS